MGHPNAERPDRSQALSDPVSGNTDCGTHSPRLCFDDARPGASSRQGGNGAPLGAGTVSFRNERYQSGGHVGPNGDFQLVNPLPEGTYKVYLTPPDVHTPPTFGLTDGKPPRPKESNIPAKYRQPGTSDLQATVTSGNNNMALRMTRG